MPSPRLSEEKIKERFHSQYQEPAFDGLQVEVGKVTAAAWDAYINSRKSPRTVKAGQDFADPNDDLAVDWIATRDAIQTAQRRHEDESLLPRVLLINSSSRSEHTCPSEMSKSWRLVEIARDAFTSEGNVEVELLDLSRLASEYGRNIYPCKACFSTAATLCHDLALVTLTIRSARRRTG